MSLLSNPNAVRLAFSLALAAAAPLAPSTAIASYSDSAIRSVETDEEVQLNQIRDQEINQLKIVMGRRQGQNRRPDILLRLAELYVEKYRHYFLKENEYHQKLIKAGEKPKRVDHARSQAYLRSATEACRAILKSKVPFDKMDQVYYFLAYNAEEMGNRTEALKYYKIVVDRYPRSTYAAESERNLAEGEFARQNFKKALYWYERAARHTQLPSYPRNLYKLAWAYFKNRRHGDALNTMKRVVHLSAQNGDKFVGLKEEALNDLVMFYSESGRPKEARTYFSEIPGGTEIYVTALKRLSSIYERTGRKALALSVNSELLAQYGDSHPQLTFDVLGTNVEIYRKAGDSKGEETALRALVEFFVKHGSKVGRDSEEAQAAFTRTKNYVRGRATALHKEGQKKNKKDLFSRSADLYGLYIRAFLEKDDSDEARKERSEIRVYRSDALIHAGRENDALVELEKTLTEQGDLKRRREAGLTLLNILLKRLDAAFKAKSVSPELEKTFLRVAEAYEDAFHRDELIPELRFKKARLKAATVARGEVLPEDAKNALKELIEQYPSRAESVDAAYDLVSSDIKAGKTEDAEELAKKFLSNGPLLAADKKHDLKTFLESVISRQAFSEIQKLEKDRDYDAAAKRYEALAATTKDQEVRLKALNNAAVSYENAGMNADALRLYETLLKRHKHAPAEKGMKALASKALWESRLADAADLYSRFARMSEFTAAERKSFFSTAIQLHWGLGEKSKALDDSKAAFSAFKSEDHVFDIATLAQEVNRTQEAADILKDYLSAKKKPARAAEAHFELYRIYDSHGESSKARSNLEEASRVKNKSARESRFAAQAAFLLTEPDFQRFNQLKIEGAESKTRTKQKVQMLESLSTKYARVVAYGDGEWGIAALERVGTAFLNFAAELDSLPAPSGLSPEALAQYRKGIEGVTGPMSARGFESLKKAYEKGVALDVTSPILVKVSQTLARRYPKQFPPAHYDLVTTQKGSKSSALRLMGPAMDNLDRWRRDLATRMKAVSSPSSDAWIEYGNLEALSGRSRIAKLFYEEALRKSSKSVVALNNLGVVSFLEGDSLAGTQGLMRARAVGEFEKQAKLNLAKAYLGFHVFPKAREHLSALLSREPQDAEVKGLLAIADLGTGHAASALSKLASLDAKDSDSFSHWYNWAVAALVNGVESDRGDALKKLKNGRGDDQTTREMISTALKIFQGGNE